MSLVGLIGKAGAGKDTVADILETGHGYERRAFADKLRTVAAAINPIVGASWVEGQDPEQDPEVFLVRYTEMVERYGYTGAKQYSPEVRRFLQVLGTEAVRDHLGQDLWVQAAFAAEVPERLVFTDVRFTNEAQAILDRGGELWRVYRPGAGLDGSAAVHSSETELDTCPVTLTIQNTGTLDDLRLEVGQHFRKPDPTAMPGHGHRWLGVDA